MTSEGPADTLLAICAEVWRHAKTEGAFVSYYGITMAGEAGYFHAREGEDRKPLIAILHPYYLSDEKPARRRNGKPNLTDDELRAELVTTAHEYGHFQSWLRSKNRGGPARDAWLAYQQVAYTRDAIRDRVAKGTKLTADGAIADVKDFYARLRAANQAELTATDRDRITDEESTAWRYGRELLVELGFDQLDVYDERARRGLHNYRYHLGIEDLWPDEILGTSTE